MGATIKKSRGSINRRPGDGKGGLTQGAYEKFRIVLIILICVFMFYPPFLRGLYFEEDQLPAEIFVFLIFMVFCVYKFLKKDRRFLRTPLDYAALGLVFVYFISIVLYIAGIRVAVAPRLAVLEWLKYCMYFSVFFMLSELITTMKTKLALLWVIVGTTICLSLIGFDGAAGSHIIDFFNGIFTSLGLNVNFFGVFVSNRIYSTLQYPNAFAAYLLAVLFIATALTAVSKKLWVKAAGGACSFILFITLVFTQSRGILIVAPVMALLFLLTLPKGSRIKCILYGIATALSAGIITLRLYGYMASTGGNGLKIWLLLVFGAVLASGLTLAVDFLDKWVEKINWKVYALGLAVFLAVVAAAGLVVVNTPARLELSHTGQQQDSPVTVMKSAVLKPGRDYKLVCDVDAKIEGDKPDAYSIIINYKREKDIVVNDREQSLTAYEGKATNGKEAREVGFTLPPDSKIVNFYFRNTYQGTSAAFNNAKIVDSQSGKTVKRLILKHKYIPDSVTDKFSNMFQSRSFVERTVYYRDSFKMMKDRWLLGGGGGAWTYLYTFYQSFFYSSTQAHNYPVQIGIECGVIGVLVLLFLVVSIVSSFFSKYGYRENADSAENILQAAVFSGILALLVHSVFDFDFSLSAVFLLFWQLLGIFNSRYRNSPDTGAEAGRSPVSAKDKVLNVLGGLTRIKKINAPVQAVLAVVLVVLFVPVFIITAKGYAVEAVSKSGADNEAAIGYMARAAQSDPFMPQYKLDYVKLLIDKKNKTAEDMEKIRGLLKSAERLAWYSPDLIPLAGSYYINIGDVDKGLSLFDRGTSLRPLRPEDWQQRAGVYYTVASYYIEKGQKDKAEAYIDKIKSMKDEAIKANGKNMNPFVFNPKTDETLERLLFAKEKIQSVNKSDLDKLVFYNIPDMDINFDGVPDQWTVSGNTALNIDAGNKAMTAENKNGVRDSYIQSRQINLAAGKRYKLEVEVLNKPGSGTIPFNIMGVSRSDDFLKLNGGSYTAEFATSNDFKPSDNALRMFIPGKYDIKSIKITEL